MARSSPLLALTVLLSLSGPSPSECVPSSNVSHSDELCSSASAPDRKPWIAVVLCGNFRTFSDPRVYKSIRANLVDALGGNVVTFIYGKLDIEYKPNNFKQNVLHGNVSAEGVNAAIKYLQKRTDSSMRA